MSVNNKKGFFIKFLLIQIGLGHLYILASVIFVLINYHELDFVFRFYPFTRHYFFHITLGISSIVILFSTYMMWKDKKNGFALYLCGKLIMATGTLLLINNEYSTHHLKTPWEVIVTYLLLWMIFPFLLFIHNRQTKPTFVK